MDEDEKNIERISLGKDPKKYRLGTFSIVSLIAIALLGDLLQAGAALLHFIPIIGNISAEVIAWIISLFVWTTFYFWFSWNDIYIPTKFVYFLITVLSVALEFTPLLNKFFALTIYIVVMIVLVRIEDRLGFNRLFQGVSLAYGKKLYGSKLGIQRDKLYGRYLRRQKNRALRALK